MFQKKIRSTALLPFIGLVGGADPQTRSLKLRLMPPPSRLQGGGVRVLCLLVSGLLFSAGSGCGFQAPGSLEVVLVDNEGFLVVLDGKKILVDGLFSLQGRPTVAVRTATQGGHPPFDDLDLILATHSHSDHFHPQAVASALLHNPRAFFLGTPQAVQLMRDSVVDVAPLENRITTLDLAVGEQAVRELAGLRIRVMNSGHSGSPEVRNYMYVLERNGLKVFHEGDAEAKSSLQGWGLAEEGLDLAFFRIARLLNPDGMILLEEAVKAKNLIPMPYSNTVIQELDPGLWALVQESPKIHLMKRSLDRVVLSSLNSRD